jgi:YggT family protein
VSLVLTNLADSVGILVKIFFVILLIRAVASFFPARRPGVWATVAWLSEVLTEPVLGPIRARIPPWGGLDLSPLIALLLAYVAAVVVENVLLIVAAHV